MFNPKTIMVGSNTFADTADLESSVVPAESIVGMVLPLFKGKGLKASEKDNYRGISLFPVVLKVFEMVILKRLEKLAKDKNYFSHLQFGFKNGTGCIDA